MKNEIKLRHIQHTDVNIIQSLRLNTEEKKYMDNGKKIQERSYGNFATRRKWKLSKRSMSGSHPYVGGCATVFKYSTIHGAKKTAATQRLPENRDALPNFDTR